MENCTFGALILKNVLQGYKQPNTTCAKQVRARPYFRVLTPTADPTAGGYSSQFTVLPVTPAFGG
jgi:hypothetical protein